MDWTIDGSGRMIVGESEDMAKPADVLLDSKTRCRRLLSNYVFKKRCSYLDDSWLPRWTESWEQLLLVVIDQRHSVMLSNNQLHIYYMVIGLMKLKPLHISYRLVKKMRHMHESFCGPTFLLLESSVSLETIPQKNDTHRLSKLHSPRQSAFTYKSVSPGFKPLITVSKDIQFSTMTNSVKVMIPKFLL